MTTFGQWLKWVLDWRFLPTKFQFWLFSRGTRAVEFVSAIGLLGFALVFWVDDGHIYDAPLYYKFATIPEWRIITTLIFTGLAQICAMWYDSVKSTVISGYLLLWAGLVWAMISVAFIMSYPPLNTGMVLPPAVSFLCALAGRNMISYALMMYELEKQ